MSAPDQKTRGHNSHCNLQQVRTRRALILGVLATHTKRIILALYQRGLIGPLVASKLIRLQGVQHA